MLIAETLKHHGIHHFSFENEMVKASLVKRFSRTLQDCVHKYLTSKSTDRYIDILPRLVEAYNETKHSSMGEAPNDVDRANQSNLFDKMYELKAIGAFQKMGHAVRITKARGAFEIRYTPN